jgi:phosphoribosyl-ATP pyrophosphohydrolase/phosphoribosyl-AMP cyclohydrolase
VFDLEELYGVILKRLENPSEKSYTASLTDELLKEKILEESQELIEADSEEDVVWEAADVLYFVAVLLAKKGVPLQAVLNELRRRRRSVKNK